METAVRPPHTRRFAPEAWRLLLPYWRSDERRRAFALLAAIVGLNLGAVYILVLLNTWNRSFYDALQQHDAGAFARQLGRFCLLAAAFIVSAVYRQYGSSNLQASRAKRRVCGDRGAVSIRVRRTGRARNVRGR